MTDRIPFAGVDPEDDPGRYVYFVKPVGMDGPIKIGCSDNPPQRLMSLAAWSPFPLEIIATVRGDFELEQNLHDCFADAFLHKEWFKATPKLIAAVSALRAGKPIEVAVDLSARVGSVRKLRKKCGGAGWSPTTRLYMSLLTRIRHASDRASKATGRKMWILPPDLDASLDSIRGGTMPSAADLARFDEVIEEPENWLLTYEERYERPDPLRRRVA